MAAANDSSATTMMLGALGGAVSAKVLDDALPDLKYDLALGDRTFTIRASTAAALATLGAVLFGVKVPGESIVVPMAAGALAYETTAEVGDDISALLLGLPMPGAPTPAPLPLPPAQAALYGQPVSDYAFRQAMAGLY